jgi:malic enzyme
VIGTGSPFPPLVRDGARFKINQTNNSYIFPGVGLGAVAVKARRITDAMFVAAAKALAAASPAADNPADICCRRSRHCAMSPLPWRWRPRSKRIGKG